MFVCIPGKKTAKGGTRKPARGNKIDRQIRMTLLTAVELFQIYIAGLRAQLAQRENVETRKQICKH